MVTIQELVNNPLVSILAHLYVLYVGFILYAGLQPSIKERRWGVVVPCLPFLIPAGIIDVLLSPVVGILVFHELRFALTISRRLDAHYYEYDWRGERARLLGKWVNWLMPAHIGGGR